MMRFITVTVLVCMNESCLFCTACDYRTCFLYVRDGHCFILKKNIDLACVLVDPVVAIVNQSIFEPPFSNALFPFGVILRIIYCITK